MTPATRAFADEIDAALDRLDVPALEREYWEQDEFLFIPRFLPPAVVGALLDDVRRLEPGLNRNYIPRHKKGGSVSHYAIADEGPALLAFYRSERFRRFLSGLVRAELKLCPDEDPHACALYFYTEPGDHMGYHYDTSYYRGARYTVLVGLVQDSSSRLQCRLHTRQPGRAPVDLAVATEPGSMVIFNGDKVYHGVSRLEGGRAPRGVHDGVRDQPGDGARPAALLQPQGRLRLLRDPRPPAGPWPRARPSGARRVRILTPNGATPMPANPAASRNPADRVQVAPVEGAAALFTPEFRDYLVRLCDEFTPRVRALRAKRDERARARAPSRAACPSRCPRARPPRPTGRCRRCPKDLRHARHRDLGPVLDHQHVHQRAQPGAGRRARRGRSRRRRGLGAATA